MKVYIVNYMLVDGHDAAESVCVAFSTKEKAQAFIDDFEPNEEHDMQLLVEVVDQYEVEK